MVDRIDKIGKVKPKEVSEEQIEEVLQSAFAHEEEEHRHGSWIVDIFINPTLKTQVNFIFQQIINERDRRELFLPCPAISAQKPVAARIAQTSTETSVKYYRFFMKSNFDAELARLIKKHCPSEAIEVFQKEFDDRIASLELDDKTKYNLKANKGLYKSMLFRWIFSLCTLSCIPHVDDTAFGIEMGGLLQMS